MIWTRYVTNHGGSDAVLVPEAPTGFDVGRPDGIPIESTGIDGASTVTDPPPIGLETRIPRKQEERGPTEHGGTPEGVVTRTFDEEQRRQLAGRALTLFERLDDLDALAPGVEESTVDELLAEWEELFHDRAAFENRLERADVTESECRAALRAGRLVDDRPLPEWVDRLESIVAAVQSSEPPPDARGMEAGRRARRNEPEGRGGRQERERRDEPDGLCEERAEARAGDGREWVFGELSAAIAAHVRDSAPESVTDTLSAAALDAMVGWFRIRFEQRFTRVLYVEFKTFVADHDRDLAVADPADFENPPTRYYDRFVDRLFDGGFATLCLEYPVFARLLAIQARQWEEHLVEFCRRVDRDGEWLAERFDLDGPPGAVTDLEPLADDTHGDGRAVMRVEFDSELTVVYKPRNVDAGETFYRILDRFSDHVGMEFRLPTYLPRDEYGWMEWIEPEGCADRAGVERYYRRAGVLICLAYLLEFTDCHLENTVAAGEYPLLVDAETVLRPFFAPARTPLPRGDTGPIQTDSVLLSHLLPQAVLGRPQEERKSLETLLAGIPIAADVVEVPYKEDPVVKAPNTDVMAVEFERGRIDRRRSVPAVDGVAQPPDEYVDPIVDGFETAYETVLALRDEGRLTEDVGIPAAFEGLENRAVYRPTKRYGELLRAVRSWDCLADGARFGIELEALVTPFTDDRTADPPWPLYEAERRALTRFDPPRLTARPGGTAIEIDGLKTGARADVSGVERCRNRIAAADRADILTQIEILRGAFGAVPAPKLAAAGSGARRSVGDDEFRAEARAIFERIREAAFQTDEGYGWVEVLQGHGFGDRQPLTFQPDNGALYGGRTGVAVFVAALYRITGEDRYREFALRAVEPTLMTLRDGQLSPTVSTLGGASGFGSIAYGVGVIGELLDRPDLLERADPVTDHLTAERIAEDDVYDVIHGSAGTILGLLGLHDRRPDPDLVSRTVECGDHLLENRVDADVGRAWLTIEDSAPLTGFAHGAAGIAYALFRLWDETGHDRYRDAAIEALAYEDGTYVRDECNWPTMRGNGADGSFPDQWCYGRAGIGLARLGMAAYDAGDAVTSGLERAMTGVPTDRLSECDHLCCGNAGRAEFLLEAQQRLGRREGEARALLGGVLARKRDAGTYRTQAYTDRLPKPTLFRGRAGIGYAMLRVTDPETLPCLLLWE